MMAAVINPRILAMLADDVAEPLDSILSPENLDFSGLGALSPSDILTALAAMETQGLVRARYFKYPDAFRDPTLKSVGAWSPLSVRIPSESRMTPFGMS